MAISKNKEQREKSSLIESTATAGQVAQAICNPDGTNIGSGAATGSSTTGTVTSVADTATSTTLLNLNTSRLGASFFNDSTEILYLKCGSTASATSFTCKVGVGQYYELPFKYSGIVDGIWANNAAGSVRVTEYT